MQFIFISQYSSGVWMDRYFGSFETEWIQPVWGDTECDKYHCEQLDWA